MEEVPRETLLEAYRASREKNYVLARLLYGTLFGRAWRHAIVGFAWLKCLDDAVDEEPDADRAADTLRRQRRLMERVYGGDGLSGEALPIPDRFGVPLFRRDRALGAPLRPILEAILETMAFDVDRRGKVLSDAELDAHVVKLGGSVLRYLAHFVSMDLRLPDEYVEPASRAYLHADSLIDLAEDLRAGLINIPAEAMERYGIDPRSPGPEVEAWRRNQVPGITALFEEARSHTRRIDSRAMRLLSSLFLARKRRHFERAMSAGAEDGDAGAPAGA